MPTIVSTVAYAIKSKLAPNAATNAVKVVPMFAPMMMDTASVSAITPLLTKPTIITVVIAELCNTADVSAPSATPRKRLLSSF